MLGALWFLQRRVSRGSAARQARQPITVVAKQALGGKAQLIVVDVEGSRYVLGVTEGGLSVVDRLPLPSQPQALRAAEDAEDAEDDVPAPLPLRRAHLRAAQAPTFSGRPAGRSALPASGAAQALRRALGA